MDDVLSVMLDTPMMTYYEYEPPMGIDSILRVPGGWLFRAEEKIYDNSDRAYWHFRYSHTFVPEPVALK